eukprot:6143412-Pleurochrysis_carterae.AAC.2
MSQTHNAAAKCHRMRLANCSRSLASTLNLLTSKCYLKAELATGCTPTRGHANIMQVHIAIPPYLGCSACQNTLNDLRMLYEATLHAQKSAEGTVTARNTDWLDANEGPREK